MTPSQTNEQALEATIEKRLTGSSLEELKAESVSLESFAERRELYRSGNGYWLSSPGELNARLAIDEARLFERCPESPEPFCGITLGMPRSSTLGSGMLRLTCTMEIISTCFPLPMYVLRTP